MERNKFFVQSSFVAGRSQHGPSLPAAFPLDLFSKAQPLLPRLSISPEQTGVSVYRGARLTTLGILGVYPAAGTPSSLIMGKSFPSNPFTNCSSSPKDIEKLHHRKNCLYQTPSQVGSHGLVLVFNTLIKDPCGLVVRAEGSGARLLSSRSVSSAH